MLTNSKRGSSLKYPETSKTLLEKMTGGDEVSWEEFIARYSEIIISLGRLKGLTDTECNDLLQEVMFRFFQNSKTFVFDPGIARFRTYFGRIIHGKIIDILRKRPPVSQSVETLPEDPADADDGPDDILNTALLYEWRALILHDAMELLRKEVEPITYCAFELYMVQEMPIDQVIKLVQGMELNSESINTWKNGVERALKKYLPNGMAAKGQQCPNCGLETLVYQEGCLICTNCGASRCG